ncbi:MAG: hypothetical protein IPK58_25205 [Acidobacteria bacterium]|nr:hypothetical protein [Acidobacteriota bacterium]
MITINGRFITQNTTGVQRFAREILLASRANNSRWLDAAELATPSELVGEAGEFAKAIGLAPRCIGTRQGHLWEQIDLCAATADRSLVNLCNTAPILKRKQVVVLHDAAVASIPINYSLRFRAWYQFMIRAYGSRAAILATVSQFSAQEISGTSKFLVVE